MAQQEKLDTVVQATVHVLHCRALSCSSSATSAHSMHLEHKTGHPGSACVWHARSILYRKGEQVSKRFDKK